MKLYNIKRDIKKTLQVKLYELYELYKFYS